MWVLRSLINVDDKNIFSLCFIWEGFNQPRIAKKHKLIIAASNVRWTLWNRE